MIDNGDNGRYSWDVSADQLMLNWLASGDVGISGF